MGKDVVAHAIHYNSNRKYKLFIALYCASLSEEILESKLSGHEKGAFIRTVSQSRARIKFADGGSLYLEEIRELYSHVQIKLLRVLETLQTTNGRKSKTAKMFGISTRKIEYKVKEWLKKWWF